MTRKIWITLLVLSMAPLASAQLGYVPRPVAGFTYSGSSWIAAASTSSSNPIGYVPDPVALYCFNSGTGKWVPADSSCFGGSGSGTGIWQRAVVPIVDPATMQFCSNTFGELSGGITASPQILTGLSSAMWLAGSCGWSSVTIIYGESADGIHFAWNTTAVISGYDHGQMFKSGSSYYYVGVLVNGSSADLFQMTAGTFPYGTWTKIQTGLVTTSGAAWHNAHIGNISIYPNPHGAGFLMPFEGDASDNLWHIGMATLTNLSGSGTVVEYAGNPVISDVVSGGICGGAQSFNSLSSGDYLWPHCSTVSGTYGILSVFRFKSTDGADHVWTQDTTSASFSPATVDEGLGLAVGGIGNPFLIRFNGLTYFYYQSDITSTQPSIGQLYDKVAVTPLTLDQLVDTQEGNGPNLGDYTLGQNQITFTVNSSTTINANSCSGSVTTIAMPLVTTANTFVVTATTDTHAVTGWGSPAAGVLYITDYPTTGNFNYFICNNTSSNITTGGTVTFNVGVK